MSDNKLPSGAAFPALQVSGLDDSIVDISQPTNGNDWHMVVIYRGWHCPMCTKFLNELAGFRERLSAIGVDIAAVSADSKEQLQDHLDQLDVNYPLFYGLTLQQMQKLGLYVSIPRSEKETDHNFPEPGMFVINADGAVQVIDISNNPFARPDLETFVSGLEWIRNPDNNYPIRGTYC